VCSGAISIIGAGSGSSAKNFVVFPRLRENHELVRRRPADVSRVCFNRDVIERASRENAAVCVAHFLVCLAQRFDRRVERVGILHRELAPAHQSESRAQLVAEFRLDLIEVDRKLAIRIHRIAHDVGDHFLSRRRVDEVAIVAILDAQ
jgi:hypothetical protein